MIKTGTRGTEVRGTEVLGIEAREIVAQEILETEAREVRETVALADQEIGALEVRETAALADQEIEAQEVRETGAPMILTVLKDLIQGVPKSPVQEVPSELVREVRESIGIGILIGADTPGLGPETETPKAADLITGVGSASGTARADVIVGRRAAGANGTVGRGETTAMKTTPTLT